MTDYRFEGLGKEWATIEAAEIAALRERVREAWQSLMERADKAEARAHAEFEIAQRERWFADDARRERDEAREDIKALVTLLRACGGDRKRLWTDNVRSEWRRIRDRKLLEVSE